MNQVRTQGPSHLLFLATFPSMSDIDSKRSMNAKAIRAAKINTLTLWAYFYHGKATCKVPGPCLVSQMYIEQKPVARALNTDQYLLGVADSPR